MKPTVFFLFLTALLIRCHGPSERFRIDGNIEGLDQGKALLQRRVDSEFITIDSSLVSQGRFTFKGSLENPEMCYIRINDTLPYVRFFNENSEILIETHIDSLPEVEVTGSASHTLLSEYNRIMDPYESSLKEVYSAFYKATRENDSGLIRKYEAEFDSISEKQKIRSLEFIGEHTDNEVSAYLIWGTLVYEMELSELEEILAKFEPVIRESIYVRQIEAHVETLNGVAVGKPFKDIILPDPEGHEQRLSQLKGNLILVDFWASWCGPCRRENPRVVQLYRDYHPKGFEIFGVSLDTDRDKWVNAIEEDQLIWYHVSDLNGWKSEAGKLYGVRAIPHTVLIDRNGIIVAKDLRGEELREKVRELIEG